MPVRHAVLQWRWLRDAFSKPPEFLVYHAATVARQQRLSPWMSCLVPCCQYESAFEQLDALFMLKLEIIGIPSNDPSRWIEYRTVREGVSKEWREDVKESEAVMVSAKYPALRKGFRTLCEFVHPRCRRFAWKILLFLGVGLWPPCPKNCLACGRAGATRSHFNSHFLAEDGFRSLYASLIEISERCQSASFLRNEMAQEIVFVKAENLLSRMARWSTMWGNTD